MTDRSSMQPKEHFGEIATSYRTYRPTYPQSLFAYLASLVPEHELAWDCATGNGQAARGLIQFFRHVIATDASDKQLRQAEKIDTVDYIVAAAEQSAIESSTIDLITVAQAVHWFDLPGFYAEVRRVAKPDGVLACWCYGLLKVTHPIDRLISYLYYEVLNDYWPPQRQVVEDRYSTINFPFEEINPPQFQMTHSWSIDQLAGYLGTWSAVSDYKHINGRDPIDLIREDLCRQWGDTAMRLTIVWPIHLRLGKVARRSTPP